jgi:hypothetical protein
MLWVLWSWYPWALEGLRLEYGHERFFRYLNGDDDINHQLNARDHVQGIKNLQQFLKLFTIYYQAARTGR